MEVELHHLPQSIGMIVLERCFGILFSEDYGRMHSSKRYVPLLLLAHVPFGILIKEMLDRVTLFASSNYFLGAHFVISKSVYRAFRYHLGSLAFGSLILAIV